MQNTSKLLIFVLIYPTLINTQLSPILTIEYLITSIKKKKKGIIKVLDIFQSILISYDTQPASLKTCKSH